MRYEPTSCPDGASRARAMAAGAEPDLRAHLDGCAHCRAEQAAMDRVRELGQRIPVASLTAVAHDELRVALVSRAGAAQAVTPATRARLGAWLLAPIGAVAAAAALLLVFGRAPHTATAPVRTPGPMAAAATMSATPVTPSITIQRAKVSARPGTVFSRQGSQPDEIVRLREGTVAVEVTRLQPGERFRVVTGDGEVEVRGTAFEVTARGDRLDHVRVLHGRVEVRPAGRGAALLGAGDEWNVSSGSAAESVKVPTRARERLASLARSDRVVAAPPEQPPADPGSESERHFRAGWTALRSGDAAAAVLAFELGQRSPGATALKEDLDFWRAVALARAGRVGDARASLDEFLDRHAASPRAGEAAAMVGWLLLDAGDLDGAAARFTLAAGDHADQARRSGREGLQAVARRRATRR